MHPDRNDFPTTSVVVPCHNCEATLSLQLEALAMQVNCDPFEVIVVSNCSVDATVAVAESWSDRMDLKVVVADEVPNVSYARNRGAREARGEFIIFIDGDDLVPPRFVSRGQRALEMGAPVYVAGFYGIPDEVFRSGRQAVLDRLISDGHGEWPSFVAPGVESIDPEWPILAGGAFGILRAVFFELGGFSLDAAPGAEDNDLAIRLSRSGRLPAVLGCTTLAYRIESPHRRDRRSIRQRALSVARVRARYEISAVAGQRPGRVFLRALAAGLRPRNWSRGRYSEWVVRVEVAAVLWVGGMWYRLPGCLPEARIGVGLE